MLEDYLSLVLDLSRIFVVKVFISKLSSTETEKDKVGVG